MSGARVARPLGGAVVLVLLAVQLGGAPFREGLAAIDAGALAVGAVIAVVTTASSAWRWRLVADRLALGIRLRSAVASYYRSQFLNLTLPGGVLGDVDRGVQHGRAVDDVGRALRAVAWERVCGQVVFLALAALAAVLAPDPGPGLLLTGALLIAACLLVLAVVRGARAEGGMAARAAAVAVGDGRSLLVPTVLLGIVASSLIAVAGHVATFVLAARAVGASLPTGDLVVAALLVLLVAAVPVGLAGWGPREGAAAWVFAASGAQAAEGLAVSVAYGAIVLVATLPGLAVILAGRFRPGRVSVGG